MVRSDLACEQNPVKADRLDDIISVSHLFVDKELSHKIAKPEGNYFTLDTSVVVDMDRRLFGRVIDALSEIIRKVISKNTNKILVIGLGNGNLTADALGCLSCQKICAGFSENEKVCWLCPGVYGVTAIESFDVVKGVVDRIKPGVVIAIDSLCAARVGRIGTSFQVSDAGIVPGSGVKNSRKALNRQTLGVEVVSIGVPMVVYASTIIAEAGCREKALDDLGDTVVTLKDIDIVVEGCAEIVSEAINKFV